LFGGERDDSVSPVAEQRIGAQHERFDLTGESRKGRCQLLFAGGIGRDDLNTEAPGGLARVSRLGCGNRVLWIVDEAERGSIGNQLPQQLDALWHQLAEKPGNTGQVAAGTGEAGYKVELDR